MELSGTVSTKVTFKSHGSDVRRRTEAELAPELLAPCGWHQQRSGVAGDPRGRRSQAERAGHPGSGGVFQGAPALSREGSPQGQEAAGSQGRTTWQSSCRARWLLGGGEREEHRSPVGRQRPGPRVPVPLGVGGAEHDGNHQPERAVPPRPVTWCDVRWGGGCQGPCSLCAGPRQAQGFSLRHPHPRAPPSSAPVAYTHPLPSFLDSHPAGCRAAAGVGPAVWPPCQAGWEAPHPPPAHTPGSPPPARAGHGTRRAQAPRRVGHRVCAPAPSFLWPCCGHG